MLQTISLHILPSPTSLQVKEGRWKIEIAPSPQLLKLKPASLDILSPRSTQNEQERKPLTES